MKTILIILSFTLTACSCSSYKQTSDNSNDLLIQLSGKENYGIKDTLITSGEREYIDSGNFEITRGKYVSGNKFIEVYENKLTKLDSWKEFYENGQLKEEGIMTNGKHIYVGIWKYYSSSGKVDSIIDHDLKYPISYYSALRIAEYKGFKMPDIEVTLIVNNSSTFWQIARWTKNKKHRGQTAEVILIDTKTGNVTKPDYQLMSTH